MKNPQIEKMVKTQDGRGLLKEIRCTNEAQHRLQAAELLLNFSNLDEGFSYLCNMVLYDPDPLVRAQVKAMLFNRYGRELETILQVESSDGCPIEEPWPLPCQCKSAPDELSAEFSEMVANKEFPTLQMLLRDPSDALRRLNAARALVIDSSLTTQELLAMSVLFDPDKRVGQQSYQSLYEIAGKEKAEALLAEVGSASMEEDVYWLADTDEAIEELEPNLEEAAETSLFGITKSDQINGLVNLLSGENNPQKRKTILKALENAGDITANDAIARSALFDSDGQVREFAKSLIKDHLGDQLDGFLDHIYQIASPRYADPIDDEMNEDEDAPTDSPNDEFSAQLRSQPSVISEGNNHLPLWLIGGAVIIAILLFLILK